MSVRLGLRKNNVDHFFNLFLIFFSIFFNFFDLFSIFFSAPSAVGFILLCVSALILSALVTGPITFLFLMFIHLLLSFGLCYQFLSVPKWHFLSGFHCTFISKCHPFELSVHHSISFCHQNFLSKMDLLFIFNN